MGNSPVYTQLHTAIPYLTASSQVTARKTFLTVTGKAVISEHPLYTDTTERDKTEVLSRSMSYLITQLILLTELNLPILRPYGSDDVGDARDAHHGPNGPDARRGPNARRVHHVPRAWP